MSSEAEGFAAATTPEQVLNAGGVSKRRRNLSNRRRSPSGTRQRRPQTPEPPRYDEDEDAPVKVPRSKSKTRSRSYGEEDRFDVAAPDENVIEASLTISPAELTSEAPKKKKETVVVPKDKKDKEKSATVKVKQVKEVDKPAVEEPIVVEEKSTPVAEEKETPKAAEEQPKVVEIVEEKKRWWQIFKKKPAAAAKPAEEKQTPPEAVVVPTVPSGSAWWPFIKDIRRQWLLFRHENRGQYNKLRVQANKCAAALVIMLVYCGIGGLVFRFTEGAFESFYKCGVKRVKRDFIDSLWIGNMNLREDTWKAIARRKLMEFEEQLHTAHEAGMTSYSGQRSWSFLNAVVYCLTVVTTIGYGHISPSTTTGRAITIIYAIFGIPMFLILLADFGKLFTRGIKFLWAFVRRVYYTGSCRKVRRTGPVQDVIKGVQLVYNFATNRRPSEMEGGGGGGGADPGIRMEGQRSTAASPDMLAVPHTSLGMQQEIGVPLDGSVPSTPMPENFEVDDEFNLPISVAIVVLLLYIFVGATMYFIWETEWGFFESFYFVFISMSTIGFGDFVPQHPMYMMASIVYLIFGLALTSMCINVVQEKLSASFQQASAKIGATIGLHMAEEDAADMEVGEPPELDITDTEQTIKKAPT